MTPARIGAWLLAGLLVASLAQAADEGIRAKGAKRGGTQAPLVDSATVALWRLDENGGTRCLDSGPYRLEATAGSDTRTQFGRFRAARAFTRDVQSFVVTPWNPMLEPTGGFSIEAWVSIDSPGPNELQTLVARWSPVPGEQSWLLGVTGQSLVYPVTAVRSPGWFTGLGIPSGSGHLVFVVQPRSAAIARACVSTGTLPLQRWVHVAATCDGSVVRLWIDGRLDTQVAFRDDIRASRAPLTIGSVLDERRLTDFGSDLRFDTTSGLTPQYPFAGTIDEVRLSSTARTAFESPRVR